MERRLPWDSPLWRFGLLGAAGFAAAAFALTAALTALGALRGSAAWILKGLPIRQGDAEELRQVRNVVDALAVGLGVHAPDVMVIDEPAPNTISGWTGGNRSVFVTMGVIELPRPEIEAMCAHEMAQLHAPDSKLVGAAFMALLRARNLSGAIAAIGALMVVGTVGGALEAEVFLPSVFAVGLALVVVSALALTLLRNPLYWLRDAVIDLADVAAVHLARNPRALAAVLERLGENERRVATTTGRCALLWFEAVEAVFEGRPDDSANPKKKVDSGRLAAANGRSRAELARRAALVEATAAGMRKG